MMPAAGALLPDGERPMRKCDHCHGGGKLRIYSPRDENGQVVDCVHCGGTGMTEREPPEHSANYSTAMANLDAADAAG